MAISSRTKAWAEQALREFPVLILRPHMLIDGSLDERNLLVKLASYRRVLDEPNSLTCVPDLLHVAEQLIRVRAGCAFRIIAME